MQVKDSKGNTTSLPMLCLSGPTSKEVSYEDSICRERRFYLFLSVIVASGHERHFHGPVSCAAAGPGSSDPVAATLDAGVRNLRVGADGVGRLRARAGPLRPRP